MLSFSLGSIDAASEEAGAGLEELFDNEDLLWGMKESRTWPK